MGGTVTAVSAIKDVNGDGFDDVAATSDGSICTVFKGQGEITTAVHKSNTRNFNSVNLRVKASQKKIVVSFTLEESASLSAEIFDNRGRRVFLSQKTTFGSGNHSFCEPLNVSPGNYILILNVQNKKIQKNFQLF